MVSAVRENVYVINLGLDSWLAQDMHVQHTSLSGHLGISRLREVLISWEAV